jgi:hypothetical protein
VRALTSTMPQTPTVRKALDVFSSVVPGLAAPGYWMSDAAVADALITPASNPELHSQ